MTLIIGGAYQGKAAYALETLGFAPEQIVEGVHLLVLEFLRQGLDPLREIARRADAWGDAAVLLEDICCGIVPTDAEERAWREAVGRCGACLAQRADRVVRVFCGIGTVMKGA